MQLAVLASALAATWTVERRSERIAALAVSVAAWGLLEVHAVREGSPRGRLRVSALDVGQGDSLLVDLPDGGAMLVDGGGFVGSPVDPGQRVLCRSCAGAAGSDRCRGAEPSSPGRSRPRLDAARDLGELWDTGQGEEEGAGATYASLAGLRAEASIRRPPVLC
jgi:competence protein ComEC